MKKYVVTCHEDYQGEYKILHQHVGGMAYVGIAHGSHNEIAKYIKDNNIDMDAIVK